MSKMSPTRDAVRDSLPGTGNRPFGRPKFTNEEPVAGIRGAGTATDPYDTGNATDQPGNRFEGRHQESAARLSQDSSDQAPAGAQVPTGGVTAPASTGVAPAEPNKPAPLDKEGAMPQDSSKVPGDEASLERPGDLGEDVGRGQPTAGGTRALNPHEQQSAGRGMMMSGTYSNLGQSIDSPSVPHEDTLDRSGVGDQSGVPEQSQTTTRADTATSPSASGSERGSDSSKGSETEEKKEAPIPQEKDYRSTGFAAEGGNFDASASGAGKEAERLRGERGDTSVGKADSARKASHEHHHGGLFTGSHKSGITMSNVKQKLHIGKHH